MSNTKLWQLSDLEWISGNWKGENGEFSIEEQWSGISSESMMGMFRMIRSDSPVFYEFMTLTGTNERIEMRIKHFSADLTGWEDKEKHILFSLEEIHDSKAVFRKELIESDVQLIYERKENNLVVILKKEKESSFFYTKT